MGVDSEEGRISVFRDAYHVAFSHIEDLRGTGRTYRACERVADHIIQSREGVLLVWRIPAFRWTTHIVPILTRVLIGMGVPEEGIRWDAPRVLVRYGACSHAIEFWARQIRPDRWHGVHNVRWVYDEGECFYHEYLDWLRREIHDEPQP